jgi:hypothetical protein
VTCGSGEETFHGVNQATHIETAFLGTSNVIFRWDALVAGKIQSRDIQAI